MGTRSLITIEDRSEELITIYRHWDGYPSVAGRDIKAALKGVKVVNGKGVDHDDWKTPNGVGRMACNLIAKLLDAGTDPKILPVGQREVGEEYHYRIHFNGEEDTWGVTVGRPHLTVYSGPMTAFGSGGKHCNKIIYEGLLDDFDPDMEETTDEDE